MSILSIETILRSHNLNARGVVQVGAHRGEQVDALRSEGFKRIHLMEANSALMPCLNELCKKYQDVTAANFTISDQISKATPMLTSETMSSPLLDEALHTRFAPSIKPAEVLTVQSQTLDSHIESRGMSAEDYNVLLIDAQGAELRVLTGAQHFLRSTDLVICNANIAEPCRQVAPISDLDLFLFDQGFIRVATATPNGPNNNSNCSSAAYLRSDLIADLQCLPQPRQHNVGMPTLGSNGRLANQMFQYLFLLLYGLRGSCDVQIPPSDLNKYFALPLSSPPGRHLPELSLLRDREAQFALETINPPRDVEFFGYFQTISRAHVVHRSLVRRLFKPKEPIQRSFAEWHQTVRSKYKRVIGLHIRRGDYKEFDAQNWMEHSRTPVEWFKTWLSTHGNISKDDGLFISSDDPGVRKEFLGYRLVQDEVPLPTEHDQEILEFLALSSSDLALLVNSSWSYMAALLAPDTQTANRVDFHNQTFVPFNAWSTDYFADNYRGPGSQQGPDGGQAELAQSILDCRLERAQLALMLRAPFLSRLSHYRDVVISKCAHNTLMQKLVSPPRYEAWQIATVAATERIAHARVMIRGHASKKLRKRLAKQRGRQR